MTNSNNNLFIKAQFYVDLISPIKLSYSSYIFYIKNKVLLNNL